MSQDWEFIRVLPNLHLTKPIENIYLAIVPWNDDRLAPLRADRRVTALLDKFTDTFSRAISPSVLLARADAPKRVGLEAVIGFRNSVAINAISSAWQGRILTRNTVGTQWSDYWDLYPTGLGKGGFFVTNSPAVAGIDPDEEKGFMGQCSPYISSPGHLSVRIDDRLARMLGAEWERAFLHGSVEEWRYQCLFRSMAMAYQACRIPMYNESLIYDFGTGLGLWVSAFECLTHPGVGAKADLITVLDLLKPVAFNNPELQATQFKERIRNAERQMNLPEHLYWQLYQTRNDFLHGNPVTPEALLAFRNAPVNLNAAEVTVSGAVREEHGARHQRPLRRPPMQMLMPLIYRLALLEFLKPMQIGAESEYDPAYEIVIKPDLEKALASALRTERRW